MAGDTQLSVELIAKIDGLTKGLNEAVNKINHFERQHSNSAKNINSNNNTIGTGFSKLSTVISGALSIGAIAAFGKEAIATTAEFEKFQAILKNTLGSEAIANLKLAELTDFAAKTPFSVRELTDSFVKLSNQGFVPSGIELRKLGDLAASTGKSFGQLAEAILDAQTGEYERLKEFGIKAKDAGDKVIFTFKGVASEVEKTSSSIRSYITNLGDAQGVSGSMAAISGTLSGRISNLGDSWDQMLKSFGDGSSGIIKSSISLLGDAIDKVTDFNNRLNTASKYNLKPSTTKGEGLALSSLTFGLSRFFTEENGSAEYIQELSSDLKKQNSEFIAGAKYVSQYNQKLKELGQNYRNAIAGVTDKDLKKAITGEYADAATVLQDGIKKLLADRAKPKDSNFGTKKGKTPDDVYAELSSTLKSISIDDHSTLEQLANDRVSAYKRAIDDLIKLGVNPASGEIENLRSKLDKNFIISLQLKYKDEGNSFSANLISKSVEEDIKKTLQEQEKFLKTVASMESTTTNPFEQMDKFRANEMASWVRFSEDLSSLTTDYTAGISAVFQSLGETLNSGDYISFGENILRAFASFLGELGHLFIKQGIAEIAMGYAMNLALPGSGVNKILGGAGMIAAGGIISVGSGLIGSSSLGGGKDAGSGLLSTPRFANGGIVSGPTLGLIGEYPGARSNPEVIAPLDKLRSMIRDTSQGVTQVMIPEVRLSGQDMYIAFKRAEKSNSRTS